MESQLPQIIAEEWNIGWNVPQVLVLLTIREPWVLEPNDHSYHHILMVQEALVLSKFIKTHVPSRFWHQCKKQTIQQK